MSYHHFGLIAAPPRAGEYLSYDPSRAPLRVREETADWLFPLLSRTPTFYQNLGQPGHGFDMAGITLVPPSSLPVLRSVCLTQHRDPSLLRLAALCKRGMAEGKFLLHYGL